MWSFWALTLLKFIHDVQLDSKTCWEQHIFNKLWQQQVTGKVLKCSNIPEDSTGWEATSDSVMAPFERSVVVWTTCSQASVGRSSPLWLFLKANVFIVNSWRIEVVVGGHQAKKSYFHFSFSYTVQNILMGHPLTCQRRMIKVSTNVFDLNDYTIRGIQEIWWYVEFYYTLLVRNKLMCLLLKKKSIISKCPLWIF